MATREWSELVDERADRLMSDFEAFSEFEGALTGNISALRELHKLFQNDPLEYHRKLHELLLVLAKERAEEELKREVDASYEDAA